MTSDDKLALRENFRKNDRLVKTKDFRRVYKDGRASKNSFLIIKIAPNNLPLNRIGFSISARSVKKAYRRNRIRRIFREVFRKNKNVFRKGLDLVLIVKRDPGVNFAYSEAEKVFLDLLRGCIGQ